MNRENKYTIHRIKQEMKKEKKNYKSKIRKKNHHLL